MAAIQGSSKGGEVLCVVDLRGVVVVLVAVVVGLVVVGRELVARVLFASAGECRCFVRIHTSEREAPSPVDGASHVAFKSGGPGHTGSCLKPLSIQRMHS